MKLILTIVDINHINGNIDKSETEINIICAYRFLNFIPFKFQTFQLNLIFISFKTQYIY